MKITLRTQRKTDLDAFETAVVAAAEVMACHAVDGRDDYMLRVFVRDIHHFDQVRDRLAALPQVERLHAEFALRDVLERTAIPVRERRLG